MTGQPPPGQRDLLVDALRGLSAIAVALFHFNELPASAAPTDVVELWRAIWKHGHLGVPVFFVISGYCIGQTWLKTTDTKKFLRRRFLRIFPPYWASLGLLLGLALVVKITTGVNDIAPLPRNVASVLATVSLLTDPVTAIGTMNWIYWSLSYEVAFYLLMAVALGASSAQKLRILLPLHIVICVIATSVTIITPAPWFFVRLWPLFGLGIAVCLWKTHRPASLWMFAAAAAHALGGVLRDDLVKYIAVAWLATAILWLGPKINGRLARALAWAGESSYSLYLIHVPVGCFVVLRFVPMPADHTVRFFAGQAIVLVSCLGLARLFFLAFERPFMGPPFAVISLPRTAHEI